jgi:hypothetical protein
MKIRNGFVSNSSSSSFVIVGFKSEKAFIYEGLSDLYVEYSDSDYIVGVELADSDEGYLEDCEISLEDFQKMVDIVAEKSGVEKEKIKIYMGTRPS